MTWFILSWMLLCTQFSCYTQNILQNPFAYYIAINRKYPTAPLQPVVEKPNIPVDTVWMIKYYAQREWVDEGLVLRIAWCESWYRNVKNKNSSAGGIYQQLGRFRKARAKKYWYEWYDRFDIEANIVVSLRMIKNEWVHHWNPSRYCWWK